jgi:hypothetical protein
LRKSSLELGVGRCLVVGALHADITALAGTLGVLALLLLSLDVLAFAIVVLAARAEAEDFSFLGFFLGGVRQDDAAGADCVSFETLYEDTWSEWFDISHVVVVVVCCLG